jgi:hypothetical protein
VADFAAACLRTLAGARRPQGIRDARVLKSGHNGPVRFRIGTAAAFCLGYVLGSRAGRERYLQIVRIARGVGRSAPVAAMATLAADKGKAAATLGAERMKDAIGVRLGWRDADQAADAITLDLAEDLATALSSRHRQMTPAARTEWPATRKRAGFRVSAQASSR